MFSTKWTIAVALSAALAVTGCGKQQTDASPGANNNPAASAGNLQQPGAAPGDSLGAASIGDLATNAANPADFLSKSTASPFETANADLKASYDSALHAFQIGDYARAASELQALAGASGLTELQKQAVDNLWLQTLKLAPNLAATNTAATATGTPKPNAPDQTPKR